MQEEIVELLRQYKEYAIFLSLLINTVISILGVIPSVFLTGANLIVFGFWPGTFISFVGEVLGAIVSFWLYRKGFKNYMDNRFTKYSFVKKLRYVSGIRAFILIITLRLLPFVPSGLVTFLASIGEVSVFTFAIASALGKIPSIIIEAYSVYQVTNWTTKGKLILAVFTIFSLFYLIKKRK